LISRRAISTGMPSRRLIVSALGRFITASR
jgi:hypothetical protein